MIFTLVDKAILGFYWDVRDSISLSVSRLILHRSREDNTSVVVASETLFKNSWLNTGREVKLIEDVEEFKILGDFMFATKRQVSE